MGDRSALDCGRFELGGGAVEPALENGGRMVVDAFLRGGSPVGARIGGGGISYGYGYFTNEFENGRSRKDVI